MALLADAIGEPAERQQVAGAVEGDAVVEAEALAREHLFGYGLETRIGDVQFGHANRIPATGSGQAAGAVLPTPQRPRRAGTEY